MIVQILLIALLPLATNYNKIYVLRKIIHESYFLEKRGFTMSDHIKIQNSNLFINLSEKQQESASGGMFYLFYQNTNVYTRGSNQMNTSQGDLTASVKNETEYQFSQTTFILASSFGGGCGSRNNRKQGNLLARIFSFL